ncbi:hypothetical protein THERMOS_1119 [Bathymodiolus thermophilus thioautotrophic gill symbiont]|uniref:Uncharacterized protein n=1 Tax=Bathymodiolus thermophilus thioautotrophic gill symbiont TaxID=2360 RepID=A0A8H8XC80_9GAMM|nr:hypothetical protein THERMOS_1119 [Bathymodiolus thermophilus thioautotrophic gill symbiont]
MVQHLFKSTSKNPNAIYEKYKTAPFSSKNSSNSGLFSSFLTKKCTIF